MSTSGGRPDTGLAVPSKVVTVGNPAAGADWQFVVAAAGQLLTVRAQLTTSAAVANRVPVLLIIDNAGHEVYRAENGVNITASTASTIVCAIGIQENVGGNVFGVSLPGGLVMGVGWSVQVSTIGLQGADQWSAIALTFAG